VEKVTKKGFSQATNLSACKTICQQPKIERWNKANCWKVGLCWSCFKHHESLSSRHQTGKMLQMCKAYSPCMH